jgi:membrane-associated phospholipid phosphatase
MSTAHAWGGPGPDRGLFDGVTGFARHTSWLHGSAQAWTQYALVPLAALMLFAWWRARGGTDAVMARVLAVPVAVVAVFVVAEVLKKVIQEPRPCRALPHAYILEKCPAANDYALPSGHTTSAAAAAVALFLLDRRLGAVAAAIALTEAASRVYVGAHYPHDVLAAIVLGALATPLVLRVAAPVLERVLTPIRRTGVGRALFGAAEPAPVA